MESTPVRIPSTMSFKDVVINSIFLGLSLGSNSCKVEIDHNHSVRKSSEFFRNVTLLPVQSEQFFLFITLTYLL